MALHGWVPSRGGGPRRALVCAALMVLALAGAAWKHPTRAEAPHVATAASDELSRLAQRCEQAMLRGVCGVMKPDASTAAASRVFIAGTGEVDAQVYVALRREGDRMCGEVRHQCADAWDGRACRIARSLYPAPSN